MKWRFSRRAATAVVPEPMVLSRMVSPGLEGVHAGGDEGEVGGAEVVGLDSATELLVLPVHLGAEVFDFHPSHALHFREDFFARGGHNLSEK